MESKTTPGFSLRLVLKYCSVMVVLKKNEENFTQLYSPEQSLAGLVQTCGISPRTLLGDPAIRILKVTKNLHFF